MTTTKTTVLQAREEARRSDIRAAMWEATADDKHDKVKRLEAEIAKLESAAHEQREKAAGLRGLIELTENAGGVAWTVEETSDGFRYVAAFIMADGSKKSAAAPLPEAR